jgi:hypothetical protein
MSLVISAVVGYFSAQIQHERRESITSGKIHALEVRLDIIESWMNRTEGNRFTARDGENLDKALNARIRLHEQLAAHGVVASRLSSIETRLDNLEEKRHSP